ncbi:hypothetical protein KH20906_18450 [Edwardsiella ictaluri]|nr:hypothetical protein KH20906_18450 [Edwardsiella ictaluri]
MVESGTYLGSVFVQIHFSAFGHIIIFFLHMAHENLIQIEHKIIRHSSSEDHQKIGLSYNDSR